jgi:phosphate acetyltransferase
VNHDKYERLIKAAQTETIIKVAVVHPCDDVSLGGAVEAARLHLIEPILVGPEQRIRDVAVLQPRYPKLEIVKSQHGVDPAVRP